MSASSIASAASAATSAAVGDKRARSSSDGEGSDGSMPPTKESRTDVAPRPHLYKHALESVFAFFSLRELRTVAAVSQLWNAAVGSMRSIDAAYSRRSDLSSDTVQSVCGSRSLARHIATLGTRGCEAQMDPLVELMPLLASRMSRLRSLYCRLTPTLESIVFPSQLTHLCIALRRDSSMDAAAEAAAIHATILSVARSVPRLQSLGLHLQHLNPHLRFNALHAFSQLTDLQLSWADSKAVHLSVEQADDLRTGSCARLRSIDIETLQRNFPMMQNLLRSPHELQWQRFGGHFSLRDAPSCALLGSLHSLTQLSYSVRSPRVGHAFLLQLPHLTDLSINLENAPDEEDEAEETELQGVNAQQQTRLLTTLEQCKQIKNLRMDFCHFTSAQMCALLPALPSLQQLHLQAPLKLDSLRCFSTGPICATLTHLTLWGSRKIPSADFVHLHALRALTHLRLYRCFLEPLSAQERSLLTPPSAILIQILVFVYAD